MTKEDRHNKYALYWAIAMLLFLVLGLSGINTKIDETAATGIWSGLKSFRKGYLLDMFGPAWSYILFRGLFTSYAENAWTSFFTPGKTFVIFLLVSFGIETAQYFHLYDATFDPWDLLAYVSILIPLFLLDMRQSARD